MAGEQVLFVCAFNVCRSPYLAVAFASRMAGGSPLIRALSRGVHAENSRPFCAIGSQQLVGDSVARRLSAVHASRPLAAADLDAALVLTATAKERSEAATLAPGARAHTFTVREALMLSERTFSGSELAFTATAGTPIRRFAEVLNGRRGTIDIPPIKPRRLLRPASYPLDIVDVHQRRENIHRRLFDELDEIVEVLATRLERFSRSILG